MIKQPQTAIPGVTDTLDFVKNLWGSMHIPGASLPGMSGMASPGLSTEDLDKRIADMKAVESWLNLNLTMLRGTIQAMEVQRGTIATLKSMGASMAEAMRQSGVSAEKMASMPFAPFFTAPGASPEPAKAPSPAKPAAAAGGASAQPGAGAAPNAAPGALPGADAGAAMGMPAAMAWWNLLQEQFTQAVATAMTPTAATAAAGEAKEAGKTAAPQTPPTAPTPDAENGNGKVRAARPKSDKS